MYNAYVLHARVQPMQNSLFPWNSDAVIRAVSVSSGRTEPLYLLAAREMSASRGKRNARAHETKIQRANIRRTLRHPRYFIFTIMLHRKGVWRKKSAIYVSGQDWRDERLLTPEGKQTAEKEFCFVSEE